MITGFNTDVDYEGRVFHVQTEDKGQANPIIESLVYSGGEIVDSVGNSYKDLVDSGACTEAAVLKLMEQQHQGLIREISNGKYDPDGPKPFGYKIISNRSLDAVVLDWLTNELGVEQIRLEMDDHGALTEGDTTTLQLKVIEESSERPVAGSEVVVKLISTAGKPQELFSGTSDADGRVEATFEIPVMPDAETAVLCQAQAAGTNSEIKRLVHKASEAAPD
jgi:hypothetical protein